MKDIGISLVLACFNEGHIFRESLRRIDSFLSILSIPTEIILIDDCSTDDTPEVIRQSTWVSTDVVKQYHEQNRGRGYTVREGLLKAKFRYAGFLDVDLEVSPVYICEMVCLLRQGYEVVCGDRIYKISPTPYVLARHMQSYGYRIVSKAVLGHHVPDTECGFKFFDMDVCEDLIVATEDEGWFWDTEVMVRAEQAGKKIANPRCLYQRDTRKRSTVSCFSDTATYIKKMFQHRGRKYHG